MYKLMEKQLRAAVQQVREEAQHRRETTPSDVAAEAFDNAAKTFELAIDNVMRETERLTPAQYAELHKCTPQTITRAIRRGELEAEEGPSGYLIARDAVRVRKAS